MKIIEPKVELWRQEDAKAHVARCCIRWIDIDKGYTPRPKQIIDCVC